MSAQLQPRDVVRFADPEDGEENLTFAVLETAYDGTPARVTVRAIDDTPVPGVTVHTPSDFVRVP